MMTQNINDMFGRRRPFEICRGQHPGTILCFSRLGQFGLFNLGAIQWEIEGICHPTTLASMNPAGLLVMTSSPSTEG